MKKWTGGVLILVLVTILVLRYSLMSIQPQKQSAHDFFRNHPTNDSHTRDTDSVKSPKMGANEVPKPSNKFHLVNVEGLSDLIALQNISVGVSRALLVWAHMHPLLSRSDALPETVQGVKEASIAWKELLSTIEKEKTINSSNANNRVDKECPFSVNMPQKNASTDEGIIIELPCGLVVDSSITLVGIPNGQHQSFQIELLGSEISRVPKPSLVLHYKVTLPGSNMTEEPFIVQNTWTNERGWGKQESCPAHGPASSQKVDGLVLCNELVTRSTTRDNLNKSDSRGYSSTYVSRGSGHESANFPFAEGSPFTATLWVGLKGFHVTVNGRHETSFAYREKLEPWDVSQVKVMGSLQLLSALAKGLPVSEDDDLLVEAEHLKAPPVSRKRLAMLVGVSSNGNNFERRMALRRSWMQFEAVRSGDVAVRFFIGLHKNTQVNWELWREVEAYGDIQLMPFVDYYSLITYKTIAICILGTKILPAKYIMKTDDDAFVRIDEVLSSLKSRSTTGLLYGLISFESSPHRDKDSKWYISSKEWPHAAYPPWAHGPGYIISRDIAKFIVRGHRDRILKLFKLEDVAMGIWIEEFKKSGEEVHYINDERFHNAGCESNYVLAHYQSPRMVLCLWDKLLKEHQPTCCE